MGARSALALALLISLGSATLAQSQGAPKLTKDQRQSLLAAVTAVNGAATVPATVEGWQIHLLRASDGSHYVAVSADLPADVPTDAPLVLYVRLAPRAHPETAAAVVARSAVEEWLLGHRNDPLPMQASRVVQVPTGELPVGGPLSASNREALGGQNQAALRLMEHTRERERKAAEDAERDRRARMEGKGAAEPTLMPFEDFDLAARVTTVPGRRPLIRRALTAGPGDYDLFISWATQDGRDGPPRTGVVKHALTLPTAAAGLSLGSVIVAEAVKTRSDPYRADQQTAHPYAIGTTEIEPALDTVFTNDERISIAFQVFNAASSPTGKPDVSIGFRLFRMTDKGEQLAGSLTPLEYSEQTVPADFSLLLGHPIIAAMAAPLRTLPRGEYRLAIAATDRLARSSTTAETRFRIIATPAALLEGAPAFSARVRRAWFADPAVISSAIDALPEAARTEATAPLLERARESRFAELLRDSSLPAADRGVGLLLQAVARYALGDTPSTVAGGLRRALDAGAPAGATQFWLGACWAAEGRDEDAMSAWNAALRDGWPARLVATPIAEALVRLGKLDEAGAHARQAMAAGVADHDLVRIAAAADIAAARYEQAVTVLAPALSGPGETDDDTEWLLIHALFASAVKEQGPGATPDGRTTLIERLRAYSARGGRNRQVADEWLAWLTSSSGPS